LGLHRFQELLPEAIVGEEAEALVGLVGRSLQALRADVQTSQANMNVKRNAHAVEEQRLRQVKLDSTFCCAVATRPDFALEASQTR
jgi:hypothetical protein